MMMMLLDMSMSNRIEYYNKQSVKATLKYYKTMLKNINMPSY